MHMMHMPHAMHVPYNDRRVPARLQASKPRTHKCACTLARTLHAHAHAHGHALERPAFAQALLASKPRHGAGSAANRSAAEALWRRLRAATERADTSPADEAGTTLIGHAPGTYPQRPTADEVPQGIAALRTCWRAALRHPAQRLDLAVISHCACGWSAGGDGAQRFAEWCAAAAPNGGRVAFHWRGPHGASATPWWCHGSLPPGRLGHEALGGLGRSTPCGSAPQPRRCRCWWQLVLS